MTVTDAVAWVSQGPIDDPYRQAVSAELRRYMDLGYELDELAVWEWPRRVETPVPVRDLRELIQPFAVYVARTLPRLDPDREQEPLVEGET